jgi:heat shock protein HslJ
MALRPVKQFLSCFAIVSTAMACLPSTIAQRASVHPGVSPAAMEEQLSPLPQPGNGIPGLQNTSWRLNQLQGSTADFSDIVVSIFVFPPDGANGSITFSTSSYFIAFPFTYRQTGLEFSSPHSRGGKVDDAKIPQDRHAGQIFESALKRICCYELSDGVLTLMDRERHSLIVLSSVQQEGIENRRWRIAKYRDRGDNPTQKDELIEAKESAEITFLNRRIFGSPGCGGWVGTYTISGDKLTIDAGSILAGLCSSQQETQSFSVERDLKGDTQIENNGTNIQLSDKDGRAMILLVPF